VFFLVSLDVTAHQVYDCFDAVHKVYDCLASRVRLFIIKSTSLYIMNFRQVDQL
jgi:hypothetical protein